MGMVFLLMRPILQCTAAAALLLGLEGCSFWALHRDVARLEELASVAGHVTRTGGGDAPIVVALLTGTPTTVVDSFMLEQPGAYFFVLPAGTYRIAAFVDLDRNAVYDPVTEPAAYYGAPTDVRVGPGQRITKLDIAIDADSHAPLGISIAATELGRRGTRDLPPIDVGTVVTFDDPRFADENGKRGLWQPVDFLFEVGAGIYFLEPFDPRKMPVLFVHGAGGTPADWRYLVGHIDRTKLQPWLGYYPSGLDLDTTARGLERWLTVLTTHYHLTRIAFVAHSMGGLVTRAAINRMAANGNGALPAILVTLSSPWNGYAAAAQGVEHAPAVIPMWRDMAPGSDFLGNLFRTPLPESCPYYLLFSYNGHSLFLDEPNDGVVALSSELAPPAQWAARKVYGFDTSHVGILASAEVSRTLNTLLADVVRR